MMNQQRTRIHQRFEREEAQRRYYIEQQYHINRQGRREVSHARRRSYDSPQTARKIRSASNPEDITGFWLQNNDGRLASQYFGNGRDFDQGLSDQEFGMFDRSDNSRKHSYVSAKRNVTRPKNGYNYHEPLQPKRSKSFGTLDQLINDSSRIYEPVEQLNQLGGRPGNDRFEDDARNSLGNNSRDSGIVSSNSRPSSPDPPSPSHYDHLLPRAPNFYDRNRRPSHPANVYHPYEVHHPRKMTSPSMNPLLTRKKSNSFEGYSSNPRSQYPRKASQPNPYEVVEFRKPRSHSVDLERIELERRSRKDEIRIPGAGNENWFMRRKSFSMDQETTEVQNIPNFAPPGLNPRPKPITPPASPRPNGTPQRTPVPTPRKLSRAELRNPDACDGIIPKSPNNSTDFQGTENVYDNPVDVLGGTPSIMVDPGIRSTTPEDNEKDSSQGEYPEAQNYGFSPINGSNNEAYLGSYPDDDIPLQPPVPKPMPVYDSIPNGFKTRTYEPSIVDTTVSRNTFTSYLSNHPLTVENNPNQEQKEEEDKVCTNFYVITTKWVAVILIALIVLACVTANKICLLIIGHEYSLLSNNATILEAMAADGKDRSTFSSKESIVIMLIIIIMVPQAISLFYGVWGKRKSQKWPNKTAILWIIFGGTIEASCISFLCLYVLTVLSIDPSLFLLSICGLFVIPTIIQIIQSAKRWDTRKEKIRIVTFTIAAGMQVAGLILLLYTKKEMIELRAKIAVPVTIALLSIAWSPKMRKLQSKPPRPPKSPKSPKSPKPGPVSTYRNTSFEDLTFQADEDACSESPSVTLELQSKPPKPPKRGPVSSYRNTSSEDLTFQDDEDACSESPSVTLDSQHLSRQPKKQSAREKAAIVMSLVQLIMTPVASVIFCKYLGIAQLEKLNEGFSLISLNHPAFHFFLTQIFVTFVGYHMAWLACSMYAQRPAFALPLTLATPLALVLIEVKGSCDNYSFIPLKCGGHKGEEFYFLIAVAVLMLMGQFLSTGYYVWANMGYIMGKASHLFWIPSYTGVLLEPFLLLNRRNKVTDDKHVASKRLARDTYVFICTTMYHEVLQEMEQLLSSIHDIDLNFQRAGRHVESHIFFDGCIKAEVMNSYILQLASVVESTLKVKLSEVTKVTTPYGMQLRWKLPGGLPIVIHLKDNTKVKNKKRWSQVMYMSYVLDYKQRHLGVHDDQAFILTTDADVKFNHESMEALLDYMVQDDQIGAVCGRTHPLGNGPMVWYQIFDYAIGHWFMKVANHVFGSVLCSPGCFSLYRCKAVRDILPTYSTTVNEAFEFLTKDMGEDRWMCTLMIQAGWRLAYCAAAEDETYCPQEFEEFYKQRRRWMPSTLANIALLVSEWRMVLKNNENISFPFIIYQVVLLCATLIGPSIVILFIVGGLVNMGMDEIAAVILLCSITMIYGIICFFFPQSTQITVAKFLTFIFAVIMIVVTIGLALQIKKEIDDREDLREDNRKANYTLSFSIDKQLPAGISTLYLAGLSAIFILAAFMHPKEALCLLNGIWYLLCLPSGYLLLTVYSIVNMTDRSWGTREGKTKGKELNPLQVLWKNFKTKCACCFRPFNSNVSKPSDDTPTKEKLMRALSRKSKKSVKSTGSVSSKKSRRTGIDSETDSELNSVRSKDRLKQGSLGKLRLALRDSLKGIGFFRHDPPDARLQMQGPNVMQPDRLPEEFGGLQDQFQGNSDESYESSQRGIPPLPVDPMNFQHQNSPINQGFVIDINDVPPDVAVPGYPAVIQDRTAPYGMDDADRLRKKTPSIYDEITTIPNPQYPYPPNVPLIRTPRMERAHAKVNEQDSAYSSSLGSSETNQRRRMSKPNLLDPSYLDVENQYFDGISNTGSMYSEPLFAQVNYEDVHLPVEEWLKGEFTQYIDNFKKHGYDSLAFISSMQEKDLQFIGIKKRGHLQKISREIKRLPKHEIEEDIPSDVLEWLEDLGLAEYRYSFEDNGYTEPNDLEDLKNMDKDTVKETFHITKVAHLNMLCQAINKLQYANQGQKAIRMARRELSRVSTHLLEEYDENGRDEYEFWETLREACLVPEIAGFDGNKEIKDKLQDLRNSCVMIFLVANTLWLIIIIVLVKQNDLKTLGVDLIGLSFLFIYGTIIILQFLAMISHRLTTLLHILARAPWVCCRRPSQRQAT